MGNTDWDGESGGHESGEDYNGGREETHCLFSVLELRGRGGCGVSEGVVPDRHQPFIHCSAIERQRSRVGN
jgi:hypothetical protein